jgi:hypothetical protein
VVAGQPNRGAQHGAEIPYAFNNPAPSWADVDRALADAMSSYWVNFATRGDPNGAGLPQWPAFQPAASDRLILGPKIEVGPGLDAVRVALFDAVAIRRPVATGVHQVIWSSYRIAQRTTGTGPFASNPGTGASYFR